MYGSRKMHFALKRTPEDPSNAIILSFAGEWDVPLRSQEVSVVFRKSGPSAFVPDQMFAYIAAPVSAITAKMRVESSVFMPIDEAVAYCDAARLTEDALREYAKDYAEVLVFHIADIEPATKPISRVLLTEQFDFWPSSTYIPLSSTGVATLETLGFMRSKKKHVKAH